MKILTLHCDYIKFKPLKKAIANPEEIKSKEEAEVKECLVVLTAVEKGDDEKNVKEMTDAVAKTAGEVKTKKIVLYPYAHLSSNLAKPDFALSCLILAEKELKKKKFDVTRAPFGYYKEFELKCKGHPLSELSKEFKPEGFEEIHLKLRDEKIDEELPKKKTQREIISEQIIKKHYILTPEGKEYSIDIKNENKIKGILNEIGDEAFKTYILYNEIKNLPKKEPPSVKEMQQQELVGYAPEADSGHFKFYPKGNLIFDLLKEWAYEIAVNRFKCLQIETPVMYDWGDKEIREQGGSFHERHYTVNCPDEPEKELVMRFAGDFGLFKIVKAATLSYRNLPLRIYEFSKSFRYEQKGELSGLKRLRAFHMPDIHCFTLDLNAGWEEYKELYKRYDDLAKGTGIKYAIVFRIVDEFYKKNKNQIIEMLKYSKAPAFIETLSGMKHYWAVKHEFQGLDSVKGSTQLSTVQLDVKDAETYGLVYNDKDNQKKGCIIVHSSVGSIERWIYCIFENAFKMEKPEWPYWLCPTQARILPISDKFQKDAEKLADEMNNCRIRTDIDDHSVSLSKKISDAERDWVPFIIVLGEKEIESKKFALRTRQTKKIESFNKEELINKIKKHQGEMPWKPLPLPVLLSKRPIFVG